MIEARKVWYHQKARKMHFSPRAKQSRHEYPRRQQESFLLCKLAENQTTGDIQILGDIFQDNPMPVLTAY